MAMPSQNTTWPTQSWRLRETSSYWARYVLRYKTINRQSAKKYGITYTTKQK